MTPEEYEAKREARYERLLAASERAEREGKAMVEQGHKMASIIPMGQPILVGHYSEGRDRRYRGKIDGKFRKGYEMISRAGELRARAEAAKSNASIFSDDPQAVEKLEDKIARLEQRQAIMKAANVLVRKGDRKALSLMGFSDEKIEELMKGNWCGDRGFPSYLLTNNNANIRRLKERIKTIEAHSDDVSSERVENGVKIVDNVEDNRLQLFFDGKPSETIRSALKSRGFRWSPTNGCWQAYRTAKYHLGYILKVVADEHPTANP